MSERFLYRRFGDATWDAILRGTGALGLVAIGLVLWLPGTATVVVFVLLSLGCHGPLSPFLPAAYEPILLFYGQLFPPIAVALVGAVASAAAEYLNYHLYRAVLHRSGLDRLLRGDIARPVTKLFARRPLLATWICAWSPLPDWATRILAAHSGYSVWRYLAAVLAGRIPKFWLLAELGLYWLPTGRTLLMIAGGSTLIALAGILRRRVSRKRGVAPITGCEEAALPASALVAASFEPLGQHGSTMGGGRPGAVCPAVTVPCFTAEAQRTQRTRPTHGVRSSNPLRSLCASALNPRGYSMIPYATGSWSSGPETHTRLPASAHSLGEGWTRRWRMPSVVSRYRTAPSATSRPSVAGTPFAVTTENRFTVSLGPANRPVAITVSPATRLRDGGPIRVTAGRPPSGTRVICGNPSTPTT